MNREELKEKISEISNSEFPLIDFFNDIGWLEGSKWFNTEKAYEDIEKIYNVFVYYKNKSKQLEKENQELKEKNKKWQQLFGCDLCEALGREMLKEENTKQKKALDILKRFHFQLNQTIHNSTGFEIWIDSLLETEELTKEEYELLKEVLGDEN